MERQKADRTDSQSAVSGEIHSTSDRSTVGQSLNAPSRLTYGRSTPGDLPRRHENSLRTRWPQFGLATLMLIMLVSAVTAAIGSYVVRAMSRGTSGKAFFVIFTLVMPVLLVVILNLARLVTIFLQRFKRRG